MKRYKNIKILDNSPDVSSAESYMDFDALVEKHTSAKGIGNGAKWGLTVLTITSIGLIAYFSGMLKNEGENEVRIQPQPEQSLEQLALIEDSLANIEHLDKKSQEVEEAEHTGDLQPRESLQNSERDDANHIQATINTSEGQTETNVEENESVSYVYNEAEPIEGLSYLYAYFRENLTYPDELRKDSIEGAVIVKFTILKDSTVANITVIQSLGEQFDNEAVRVVESMPKWKPASVNGTPVSTNLSIPLTFHIER